MQRYYQEQIDYILSNFDFDVMHSVMTSLNWTWEDDKQPPNTDRLRSQARAMLEQIITQNLAICESGGFRAEQFDNCCLRLSFVVADIYGTGVLPPDWVDDQEWREMPAQVYQDDLGELGEKSK